MRSIYHGGLLIEFISAVIGCTQTERSDLVHQIIRRYLEQKLVLKSSDLQFQLVNPNPIVLSHPPTEISFHDHLREHTYRIRMIDAPQSLQAAQVQTFSSILFLFRADEPIGEQMNPIIQYARITRPPQNMGICILRTDLLTTSNFEDDLSHIKMEIIRNFSQNLLSFKEFFTFGNATNHYYELSNCWNVNRLLYFLQHGHINHQYFSLHSTSPYLADILGDLSYRIDRNLQLGTIDLPPVALRKYAAFLEQKCAVKANHTAFVS